MGVEDEEATLNMYKAISSPSLYNYLCIIIDMISVEWRKRKRINPSVDVIGEHDVKFLTFGTWLKHKLNGGE
ncbi:hypothetical protein HAX54_007341, partial [Datura stramonium]|nr:hypothetical protein [Datura stramonium]